MHCLPTQLLLAEDSQAKTTFAEMKLKNLTPLQDAFQKRFLWFYDLLGDPTVSKF